ncbi:hypothetical protein H1O16_gp084 [Burkholderia phage BcepSaruman]|uniref:Uncharacterized protein n=1 Tax=Burkholderia phage BcepSaruman TaxID=2530032 RepID=A0A4D5ZE12_9CAUD|nr:hypothetical protein H1O16_gp084 [Burkholderia phage BcepSaruman]QBX06497.1 hypothetical protein BcepSaruman_084 [Burkholderia phage BcepSaruman]
MAILTKEKEQVVAARENAASTSLHFPNETTKAAETSEVKLRHGSTKAEMLHEPGEEPGGSTHFNNDTKFSEKTNRMNGGKTTAAADEGGPKVEPGKALDKPKKHPGEVKLAPQSKPKVPTEAGFEDQSPNIADELRNDEAPAGPAIHNDPDASEDTSTDSGVEAAGDGLASRRAHETGEVGQQSTQTMPNDIDPADGYITTGETPTDGAEPGTAPVLPNADSGAELEPGAGATEQSLMLEPGAVADVDTFEDAEDEPGVTTPALDTVTDDEILQNAPAEEEMPIVDIDGVPDDDVEDVVFANVGTDVRVLKGPRVIANLSQRQAVKAGVDKMYLSDNFASVTASEMEKHGLRAGLKGMGFVLATVNLGKADVLNKRVEAKALKLTAGLRAEAQAQDEAMDQCMAIAAVGINRAGYFKDVRNELRASLEAEFSAAGVRGAEKLIRRVFASAGVDYAKAILTIASQLRELPVEVRNSHVTALNMLGDDEGMDEEEDDHETDAAACDTGPEFVDQFEEDSRAPTSVKAALFSARPGYASPRRQATTASRRGGMSVTAAAILSGEAALPFGM